MDVKKAKKVIARPVQVNSNQTSSATTTTVRTAVAVTRPTFIGIKDVQRLYEEFLGKPGSHTSHHLLHTSYNVNREQYPSKK